MKNPSTPSTGVPRRIRTLERFGTGNFGSAQRDVKCAAVAELMRTRGPVPAHPRFSVIVPAHREERYLLATLRSLAEQTNPDAEFLIVVNGEPRGSMTQRMAEQAGFVVLHEARAGVGRARQIGLEVARGEIVVTTDADTLHDCRWLDAIDAHWRKHPGMAAGFGRMHSLSDSTLYQFCSSFQNITRAMQGRTLLFGAAEANSWFLRDAALAIGGYDIRCRYAEGLLLLKKLQTRGRVLCCWDRRAAIYTSDRRDLRERLKAATQYIVTPDAGRVPYAVVR